MDQIQKEQLQKQIIKMTRSIKTLSEKEIRDVTDQLIRDQIGREEVYYRRKNFLAGNGYMPHQGFSDRVKHAAVGTPLEREPANEAQEKLNHDVRKGYNATRREMHSDERKQRKLLEKEKQYRHIHSKSFATEYQYEILGNAKKWMMDNPEAYAKNKKVVDAIYKDMYTADEALGAIVREIRYYEFMEKKNPMMEREVDRRVFMLHDRQNFLQDRLSTLSDALRFLLRGQNVSDLTKETLQEYMDIGPTETQKQEAAKRAAEAEPHADY